MDLYYLDYLAISGRSWLHRTPAGGKLVALALLIVVVLTVRSLMVSATVLATLLLLAVSARLPLRVYLGLTLYPLVFLAIIFLSMDGLTLLGGLTLAARVLAITAGVILVLLSTGYPAIFAALGRVLPGGLVAALFFTYRALFILSDSITHAHTALHLRGGISARRPLASIRNMGAVLAHVLVHAVETSQRMAENMTVRGFKERIYY